MLNRISEEYIDGNKVVTYSDGSKVMSGAGGEEARERISAEFSRCWDNLSTMQQIKINSKVVPS